MSLPRFYLTSQVLSEQTDLVFPLELSNDDLKHAHVLRLVPGEHIAVIDSTNDYFECKIVSFDQDNLLVKITTHCVSDIDEFPFVILAQGLAKGDKMETVLRHSTELGVRRFIPFSSERSVLKLDEKRKQKKLERWRTIVKNASMQSGQPLVPDIDMPCSLRSLIEVIGEVDLILVCWEETPQTYSLKKAVSFLVKEGYKQPRVAIVVGPEGGLSEDEVSYLSNSSSCVQQVSLGPSILRTETAGIVAPALVIYELGGLEKSSYSFVSREKQGS